MKVTFSLSNPLLTVSEDDPSEVTASARMHVEVDGKRKDLGPLLFTGDAGDVAPPETFELLHRTEVAEGRALPLSPP